MSNLVTAEPQTKQQRPAQVTLSAARKEPAKGRSLLRAMAERYGMEPDRFRDVIVNTVLPANERQRVTNEQLAAFLLVAHEHNLNPLTREIYAFPTKGGGIQPIVSIDGWLKLINSHPEFDGMEFEDHLDSQGRLVAITCRMFRKDRSRPTEATEYMEECRRNTETWRRWPRRMLRHKATIQAARYAFGFSGIVDEDEAERRREAEQREALTPPPPPPPAEPTAPVMEAEVVQAPPTSAAQAEEWEAALRGLEAGLGICPSLEALRKMRAAWDANHTDLPEDYQRQADEMFEATEERLHAAAKQEASDNRPPAPPPEPQEPPLIGKVREALASCASVQDVDVIEANYAALIQQAPADVARLAQEMIERRRRELSAKAAPAREA